MRSFLLASLASLATQQVYGHPAHVPTARTLSRRAVDLNAFRQVLDTEYINATSVQSVPSIASLTKRADAVDTATELVKTTVSHYTLVEATEYICGVFYQKTRTDTNIHIRYQVQPSASLMITM